MQKIFLSILILISSVVLNGHMVTISRMNKVPFIDEQMIQRKITMSFKKFELNLRMDEMQKQKQKQIDKIKTFLRLHVTDTSFLTDIHTPYF